MPKVIINIDSKFMELKFSNYKKEVFVGASIKQTVIASDEEAQYDEKAKKLLGHKIILAYILVNTIDEFRGMNPKDVVKYIEGEPHINVVPIDPGVTNTSEKTETESIHLESTSASAAEREFVITVSPSYCFNMEAKQVQVLPVSI